MHAFIIDFMSQSFTISAFLGPTVIAQDVLFTSSHPNAVSGSVLWTKTPAYAAINDVPLKAGLLDQFRKAAGHNNEVVVLGEVDHLLTQFNNASNRVANIDVSKERELVSGGFHSVDSSPARQAAIHT